MADRSVRYDYFFLPDYRAAMLSQLQSTIRSINQDLASLVVVIEML